MSNRITSKDLDVALSDLRIATGRTAQPYERDDSGNFRANVGALVLSGAYGGWELHEIVNEAGGVRVMSSGGYVPARSLYEQIRFGAVSARIAREA